MSESMVNLGESIFNEIDHNDFLNSIYDNMLYNYALIKFNLTNIRQKREVDIDAALRFADLLSKSTHSQKADDHKKCGHRKSFLFCLLWSRKTKM